jgi:hypothetical protein
MRAGYSEDSPEAVFMKALQTFLLIVAAIVSLSGTAWATDNRYLLASQSNFGAKRGFYVDLENSAPGQTPCRLRDTKLALGVADGSRWDFAVLSADWQTGSKYIVTATIGPHGGTLAVSTGATGTVTTGLLPDPSPLISHQMPDWASGPADYQVQQTKLILRAQGQTDTMTVAHTWPAEVGLASALELLAGTQSGGMTAAFKASAGATVTIKTTFEFVPRPADPVAYLRSISPLVDRYGQAIAAHWPSKVTSDQELSTGIAAEAAHERLWLPPPFRDAYGGVTNAGWSLPASGFYRLTRHDKRWWLITPAGHPCFYLGLDTVPDQQWGGTPVTEREFLFADLPPHDGLYAATWSKNSWGDGADRDYVNFTTANLIRKYGPSWSDKATQNTVVRLRKWGFSGMSKWSAGPTGAFATVSSIPVLEHQDVPNLVDHPDIFDPAVQAALRDSLRKQILPQQDNPEIVAWSVGNEYDEIIKPEEIKAILAMPATVPAQQALFTHALDTLYHGDLTALQAAWKTSSSTLQPPEADVEALRQFYESSYYAFLYATVKKIDPHHLYAGYWPSIGWWVGPQDWRLLAPNCDVIGYDRYSTRFADPMFQAMINETNKPILCGEFSYPPFYHSQRGYGKYGVSADDDADAGKMYARWVATAAAEPDCVGVCWFEYRDEPLTGRGPGEGPQPTIGEHYAFGLVDDADQPKWGLVNAVRAANLDAVSERLKAEKAALSHD